MEIDNKNEQSIEQTKIPIIKYLRSQRSVLIITVLFLFGLAFLIYVISAFQKRRTADLFRQYIVNPIPVSVTQIKVDHPQRHGGYGYVFRFNINQEDYERICESRPFRDVENLYYINGKDLSWDWKDWISTKQSGERGVAFGIYDLVRKPSWYDLPTWENPEAHALHKVDEKNNKDIQVLLYNRDIGQAYFITFHYSGRGL